jgi:hypothetical protein
LLLFDSSADIVTNTFWLKKVLPIGSYKVIVAALFEHTGMQNDSGLRCLAQWDVFVKEKVKQ